MIKPTCKDCKRNFKSLTEVSLCASCYLNKYGIWPKEFSRPPTKQK